MADEKIQREREVWFEAIERRKGKRGLMNRLKDILI